MWRLALLLGAVIALAVIRLMNNKKLDGACASSRSAFIVYVNGVAARRAGLQRVCGPKV